MKQIAKHTQLSIHRNHPPQYPNAADNRYYRQKILDIITAIVSVAGFVGAMVFLATMS